jgi:biopolymer transport protein TolQ
LTEPLSILQLVLNASVLVQIVLLLLLFASIMSWVMIFQRMFALKKSAEPSMPSKSISGPASICASSTTNSSGRIRISRHGNDVRRRFKEYSRLSKNADADAVMQGVQRATRGACA